MSQSQTPAGAPLQPLAVAELPPPATHTAAFPRVNLIPDKIAEEAKVRSAKLLAVGGVAVSAAIIGALLFMANADVSSAQDQLDAAQAQSATLHAQAAQYASVPLVYAQVTLSQQQLAQSMGGEVRWSYLLNDVALTIPKGVALTTLTGSINGATAPLTGTAAPAPAAGSSTTSVLGKPGIGNITFAAQATSYNNVALWLDSLAKQSIYVDPYVTSATQATANAGDPKAPDLVTFSSTVTITNKALSHRFDGTAGN
jgi:Tfp pilus assembly protein PilN